VEQLVDKIASIFFNLAIFSTGPHLTSHRRY
jgi:hypothetical protein